MTAMVESRHLCKRVQTSEGELVILEDISIAIEEAEAVAIVGASG
jgi:putative ABC transport system ATP-binding protein